MYEAVVEKLKQANIEPAEKIELHSVSSVVLADADLHGRLEVITSDWTNVRTGGKAEQAGDFVRHF